VEASAHAGARLHDVDWSGRDEPRHGAAGATINRLPVLLLPGDVFASRRIRPVLQQLESPVAQGISVNDTLRPVSRYWDRIERPEQLLAALPEAMRVLTSVSETGAVTLALPQDTQVETVDYPAEFLQPRVWRIPRPEPEAALLDAVAQLAAAAHQPMIVAGGGVRYSEAEEELDAFARAFSVPVAETQAGKGSLAWDHPWNLGPIGATGGLAANRYAAAADLVIEVGARLADFTTASWTAWQNPDLQFVGINVAEADAARAGAIALVADARQTLRALRRRLAEVGAGGDRSRMDEVARLHVEWRAEVDRQRCRQSAEPGRLTQPQVIAAVNDAAGTKGTVVCAAGSMPGDLHKLWRAQSPDDYHVEYGYSCMGYEIAGALGVKIADPSRDVFVLVGDGSYLMMNSEITTSIQEGAPLTIVVVDSHGFASIGALARSMGGRNNFNELRARDPQTGRLDGPYLPVDFAGHAASMGATVRQAATEPELAAALADARQADRTNVIVVEVDTSEQVPGHESWWDVPVAEESESPTVKAAREKYEEARVAERWHG